jgi:hemolysin D
MSVLSTLREYTNIASASLRDDQKQLSKHAGASDAAFLPAALEIMESPPSPVARTLLLSMCGFVGVAVLWAVIGRVDIVAVAPGKLVPEDRVKTVQWGGAGDGTEGVTGVVRAIHVKEGQQVKAGQLLLELDSTLLDAAEAQADRGLSSAELEQARGEAIARYLRGQPARLVAPSSSAAGEVATQRALLASTIAEYEARRASLSQQRLAAAADREAAAQELAKLQETLPLIERQEAARRQLADKGYGSKLLVLQVQEQLINHRRNINIQRSTLVKTNAAIANLDTQLIELRQGLFKSNYVDLAEAADNSELRQQEKGKAVQRRAQTRVVAPVDGTVLQLETHTIGGVVQAAQPLVTIVPATSRLVVEARIDNRDIGFVREGQAVNVKLETFPFTTYGLVQGELLSISADAQPSAAKPSLAEGGSLSPAALVYVAQVSLKPESVQKLLANAGCAFRADCSRRLLPGMMAQVEIKTGTRRIIDFLLSPIEATIAEAGRER